MQPKISKRTTKKSGGKEPDFGGLDPNVLMNGALSQDIFDKIPPNPITGKVDILDIVKYIEQNPNEAGELMKKVDQLGMGKPTVDLTTFEYKTLSSTIVHESSWVLQLESMGFVDKDGNEVDPNKAHSSGGIRPAFIIYCYDDRGTYRLTQECIGLPDSKAVLQALQRAIVEPLLPLKRCLPWFLLISIKLSQHAEALKPFLDTLPAPFHWRVETREESEDVHDGVHNLNQEGIKNAMILAERSKTTGNKAYSKTNRKAALTAYAEALSYILDVFSQKPSLEEEEKAKKLQAIIYANRAATHLLSGDGLDMKRALEDGQAAEKADPSYSKAYIRQASASQLLGNMDEAQDAIARALRRKDLEDNEMLVDRLIELATGGKGLSDDEATFKNWMLDILSNDQKSSTRFSGLEGEWKRRCDAHFQKFKR